MTQLTQQNQMSIHFKLNLIKLKQQKWSTVTNNELHNGQNRKL